MCFSIDSPLLMSNIICQHGSAWQFYMGRWFSEGKHAFFHRSALKTIEYIQTIICIGLSVRPMNIPNCVEIGSQGCRHTVVKCHGFVTFVLLFSFSFRFFISPIGRNYGPILTLRGSNDVFCLVNVPFQGSKPSNSF